MKKYTPLDGLRWSRNSDSALNNMPQTDVLGRAGGGSVVTKDIPPHSVAVGVPAKVIKSIDKS